MGYLDDLLEKKNPTVTAKKKKEETPTAGVSNLDALLGIKPVKNPSATPVAKTETKTPKQTQVESKPFADLSSQSFLPKPDLTFGNSNSTRSIIDQPIQVIQPSGPKALPKDEKISAAPVDNRPVDTVAAKVGRYVTDKLPSSAGEYLQKELGIDESQRKQPELSTRERVLAAGTAQTQAMLEKNPQAVGYNEYLARGLSFGNNIDIYERYKEAKSGANLYLNVDDVPEPVTLKNKIAEGIGNTITMLIAEPLIAEAGAAILTKIPGGSKVLSKIAELSTPKAIPLAGGANTAFRNPGVKAVVDKTLDLARTDGVAYVTSILKRGAIGSLFGLIQENKKSVAENVVTNAGLFAGFEALAYPIQAFFRPIMQTVSKAEINNPNLSRALRDPSVTQEPVTRTLWFRNPNDSTQVLKVTANGVKFVPKNSPELVKAGVNAEELSTITKLDLEAFQIKPSLYDDLVNWVSGKAPKANEIPFTVKDNMPKPGSGSFTGASPVDDVTAGMTSSEIRNEITKITEQMGRPDVAPEVVDQLQSRLIPLRSALKTFEDASGKSTVSVRDDSGKPVANIKTVEYGDGQFGVKIEAGTPNQGMVVDYDQTKTYPTEEKAVEAAKQELATWAKETAGTTQDPQDAVILNKIVENIEPPKSETAQSPQKVDPAAEIDALAKYVQERVGSRNYSDSQTKGKELKGAAMEIAAVKRGLVGSSTPIELQNARKYLQSNYQGKPVEVGGLKGTVTKPSFGKIGVKFDDGTVKFVQPGQITSQKVTDQEVREYIRAQAQKRLEGLKYLYSGFKPPEVPKQASPTVPEPTAPVKTVVAPKERAKIVLQDTDLHNRIMSELLFAEAGKRIAVRKIDTAGFDFSRQASTFPKWIPKELRHKVLLDAVAKHITDGTIPTKAAEVRLYDIVAEEMRGQDEVLNDTKFIENARKNLYNPFASDAENAAALAKFDEEYAKLKQGQPASTPESGSPVQPVVEAVQSEIIPEKAPVPVEAEVAAPKPPEPAKKAELPKNEKLNSAVYERLKAENPELSENVTYTEQNLRDNAEKAVKLIAEDKEKAYRIAMGVEEPPANQTATAINIALAEKALEEGNNSLYGQLVRNRSLAQTRRGQEIVAEKGSVTDNSVSKYVKTLINTRLQKLGDSYLGDLSDKMLKSTKAQRAIDVIDAEVKKVKARIKSTKELDLEEAQKFLDSLACK